VANGTLVDSTVLLDILTEDPTWQDWLGDQVAFSEIGEESDFRLDSQSGLQQVRHLTPPHPR
jgi:hypothetical protein